MSETVFTYAAPGLKFGRGASDEIGWDVHQLCRGEQGDARRVLLVTDPGVAATGHPERIAEQMRARGLGVVVHAGARVEPTDASLEAAVASPATPVRSTPSSRSAAARPSTRPRPST
jgi:hydroxyacid-oxoacid transhydrogenase